MPQPKVDLSKVHGRIRYAREMSGDTQEEFALKMDYTLSGWQKIEQGKRSVPCELLKKINEELRLDVRYYFGDLPYEDAVDQAGNNYSALVEKISAMEKRLMPINQLDEVTSAWLEKQEIRQIVGTIGKLDAETLRVLNGVIFGFMASQKPESERAAANG